MADDLATLISRRAVLRGAGAAGMAAALPARAKEAGIPMASFPEIAHGVDETHHVSPGHEVQVLLRWGDPLFPDSPPFDPLRQSAAAQARQFGYNNDYIGYVPLGRDHALLCVNHEYASGKLMFPGGGPIDTAEHVAIEQAAMGISVVEVKRKGRAWQVVSGGRYNRRITVSGTPFAISGPARGSARLMTTADPKGEQAIGTLANCAGGVTPWGSYLSGEENIDFYFSGVLPQGHPETRNHKAMGVPDGQSAWGSHEARFDVGKEPNEANRFGWVVEIDPFDPASVPRKRTALGRFKHEGAETVLTADGRLAVYMGDDEVFQFLYRFVSRDKVNREDRAANRDLLDHGTLSVARFAEDGSLVWLPLRHGEGPLTAQNGFTSQADVLIEARYASRLLGATPMDRPEDVQPHPRDGRVYVMLTNNAERTEPQQDKANPRAKNASGHIIELRAPGGDHGADRFAWDVLVLCGPPDKANWAKGTSANGWFSSPDNCAIDPSGRLWVATDQGSKWPGSGTADGLWALGTDGEERGLGRMFFRVPVGAEMCGPCFAPDGRTLFAAVQHPGSDGAEKYTPFGRASRFDDPVTRWPDFDPAHPPRPSVIAIRRTDGATIGS